MSTVKLFSFFMIFLLASPILSAEEHGHDQPAKEEKSEGGEGHGGGEDHGGTKVKLSPLVEAQTKVQELAAKIRSKQSMLQKMFEEKNALRDNSPELKAKVKDILKEHAELQALNEEYNKQLNILKYRFPERGGKPKKKYDQFEVKSVIEMEQALGVDGKLNRNMSKLRSQYKLETKTATSGKGASKSDSTTPTTLKAPEGSIEDAGSVLLQK